MAKQGQHHGDVRDSDVSRGHNDPAKSQTIVTGTYKKQETYHKQAAEHKDPGKHAPATKNEWNEDTRDTPTLEGSTRARHPRSGRSGSDSNAGASTGGR